MSQPLIPPFGKRFQVADYDPGHTGGASREAGQAELLALRSRLSELQNLLYADRRQALLVVLQGIDTAGKDGTVTSIFREVGPLGCSVENFGVPSDEEMAHDFLWRYHLRMPGRGRVVIFNRSYYEAVVVERVKGLVPPAVWKARYAQINEFERYLASEGTVIAKFFLHISKEEQRERLQERVDNPKKQWKFRAGDLEERKRWGEYQEAFEDMVDHCNTETAPWHVVPADRNWYRDLVVARAVVEKLESLDLHYPDPAPGVIGTVVE